MKLLLKFNLIFVLVMALGVAISGWISRSLLQQQAQRVLAGHVGPIAKVVVKRAAERSRECDVFFNLLAEAVPESTRGKLLTDLARLAGN